MLRLILIILLFTLSLFNFFPVPVRQVWYLGILVTEYPWVCLAAIIPLIAWSLKAKKFRSVCIILSVFSFAIFFSPIIRAYQIANDLQKKLTASFGLEASNLDGFYLQKPFSFFNMFKGDWINPIPFETHLYATHSGISLSLNFTPSAVAGVRPCLVVVHGGAWAAGNNSELAHVNNYFAHAGYQVATINYRLAPQFASPAQQQDVKAALGWLKTHSIELKIDTSNFVLLGRSAGAQIALAAAYTFHDNSIKGVADFYGPTDMEWSYNHPANLLVIDSKKVISDFLGGTPQQAMERYVAESPLLQITNRAVPTLIVHGKQDAHVYFDQSVQLSKKLDAFKIPNLLLALPWATHGCEYNLNGPSGQLAMYATERFFYAVTHKIK